MVIHYYYYYYYLWQYILQLCTAKIWCQWTQSSILFDSTNPATYLEDIKTALYLERTTVHCDNVLMPVNTSETRFISDEIMLNNLWHYLTEACPLTPVHILQQIQAWNLTFMTEDAVNFGRLINTMTFSLLHIQNKTYFLTRNTSTHTLHSVLLRLTSTDLYTSRTRGIPIDKLTSVAYIPC